MSVTQVLGDDVLKMFINVVMITIRNTTHHTGIHGIPAFR